MQISKNSEQQKKYPEMEDLCSYKGQLKKAIEIAGYYGFHLIEPLTINKRLPSMLTKSKKELLKNKDFSDFPRDYMSTLKKYIDDEMFKLSQPVMICHIAEKPDNLAELRLEIIGTKKSIAEATVIKAASVILEDLGYKNISVRLNSIGDKDSANSFLRELTNYYRGNISNLSPALQSQLKKDILKVYSNRSEKYKELNENAPRPIGFLSEESRKHLGQIIEFLENMNISYEIRDDLVGTSSCLPKTLFEIFENSADDDLSYLAHGERHSYLAQNIGFNKKVPIVGIGINIKRKEKKKDIYQYKTSAVSPKIYFIHLGFDAKKKSLNILDVFRRSRVPIHQSLCNDSFAGQLERAQSIGVPYTMIMGQKEVMEDSIIFRDMETRYQENVSLPELEGFLLRLRKKKVV